MASFESVADEYDTARPSYPEGIFDALGPLGGLRVLDIGAGTGIATRELLARGATTIALDHGPEVLRRARARTPDLDAVVGDGAVLPIHAESVDLVTCAQAWHWLDPTTRVTEMHRVLPAGGRWAGWWSHARADDEVWFDSFWSAVERACPAAHRDQRNLDWGSTITERGLFDVGERITVPWEREITVDDWLTDLTSHSYVAALPDTARVELLDEVRPIVQQRFDDGSMRIRYETWLWIATRR